MKLFTSVRGQLFALFQTLYIWAICQRRTAQQQLAIGLLLHLNRALQCTDVRSYVSTHNVKLTPFLTAFAHRSTGGSVLILASYVLILTTLFVCPAAAQTPENSGVCAAAKNCQAKNKQPTTKNRRCHTRNSVEPAITGGEPSANWRKGYHYLEDYRGKLIILDFDIVTKGTSDMRTPVGEELKYKSSARINSSLCHFRISNLLYFLISQIVISNL
ncbi:hypothetical protein [Olivibacter sitiensis]|uniref:hypothetical protein n=1 Tax=Olivibacter sitiensis TaxID=376470 RepID=UPI00040E2D2C|nr:hypothetical protein [Olivibacter sitiensis]